MFCSCSNDAEDKEPNTVVCPVCLGMPGTLPVTNKKALELTAKIGLALGSKIADVAWFDRKHYFYPDLPKGYQISQYQNPFCEGGSLTVSGKEIRFNRVHLEEDAGKLSHKSGSKYSHVDLNRAGTPLAEIVTEPDIESAIQAKEFLQELRELLRGIEVSDADMEKGHLRCDANISLTKDGKMSPIVEIKNLNSFKFVEKALAFEEKRLANEFASWPESKTKVTRGFNSEKGETYTLREKEEAKDYRYFPEPDIPPIELGKIIDLELLKSEIGQLPSVDRQELIDLGIDEQMAKLVIKDKQLMAKIKELKSQIEINGKLVKTLVNEKKARDLNTDQLKDLVVLLNNGTPSNLIRQAVEQAIKTGNLPSDNLSDSSDEETIIKQVIAENSEAVEKIKAGKQEVMGFLVGQAMRLGQGKINPGTVRDKLLKEIKGE